MESEIRTAESLTPEPSDVEFEVAIGKLERNKSRDIYQFPTEVFKARGKIFFMRPVNLFILSAIRRNGLISGISRPL